MTESFSYMHHASLAVVSLLLFLGAKPMLQGASRATEALLYLFGTSPDPRRRNIVGSAEHTQGYQDLVADTVIKETLLPGILLFSFAYLSGTADALHDEQQSTLGWVLSLSCVISFGLSRMFSGAERSAATSILPVTHIMSLVALFGSIISTILFSIPLESVVAALIIATFASQFGIILIRSVRTYGIFSVFWIPAALFAWLSRVFASAMAAPLTVPIGLVEAYLDRPSKMHSAHQRPTRTTSSD